MSVAQFLESVGLGQYADVFEKEAIDADTLADLDDGDLRHLGLPLGHRKKLLQALASDPAAPEFGQSASEFRRVSVLFCDLVGSTELSQKMTAEEFRDLLAAFQRASVRAVEARGGHVAKYLGDGLMAYFGYPRAYEDDAVRAVEAAFDMLEGVHRIDTPTGSVLRARIGIHSGPAIVGEMGAGLSREKLSVVGEAPIIASRLEQMAEADEILISGEVCRLVEGFVLSDALGERRLKGVDRPIMVHRPLGRTEARSRFEATRGRGLTRITGRSEEIALIRSRWNRVRQGDGQVFVLSGEPGIGKSRIVTDLHDHVLESGCKPIVVQCSEQHGGSALYPFIDALDRAAGVIMRDDAATRLAKLLDFVGSLLGSDAAELMQDYLSASGEGATGEDAARRRRGAIEVLLKWMCSGTVDGFACIIVEDVHWSDPSSRELIGELAGRSRESPILLVVTTRLAFAADWASQHNATMLSLNRLGRSESQLIVDEQFRGLQGKSEQMRDIIDRAEGVPLFLEELSRAAKDMEHSGKENTVPATLHGSLTTRLDGLGKAKHIAQVGSVLGRRFPGFILSEISCVEGVELEELASRLVGADILVRHGASADAEYSFTHALVQDAAYASLLNRDRRRLHGKVADHLSSLPAARYFPVETIAGHLFRAERFGEAAKQWLLAGRDAQKRSADHEAVEHFYDGLRALEAVPPSRQRDESELEIVRALAPLVLVVKGWSSTETSEIYARARVLSQKLDEPAALLPILYGEYLIHVSRAEFNPALKLARELLKLAEDLADDAGLLQGHRVIAWCSLYLGRLADAEKHASRLLALYRSDHHSHVKLEYGYDPRVAGLSIQAIISALGGDAEASKRSGEKAVAHARAINHASSLAYALMFACAIPAAMRSDMLMAGAFAQELRRLADDQRSELWAAYADIIQGWAGDDGAELIKSSINRLSVTARNPWRPFFLALCADSFLRSGHTREALAMLNEAASSVKKTDERSWEAGIYRLLGRAEHQRNGGASDSERDWIMKAIDAARRDGSVMVEERARVDLARI
ncbi:AAA family ATPase [Ruegeria sp. WL0004]|uniref:AAA family ATPase n=1 Tax=Ruegeria marisflavi TaxID=2984152 RepID=A0ABT2WTD8_9RHOB|nr:adenylate/guanylate cyclase domain-containing protein [Ruegeria sp. WL0004]MCU9839162.1 AAA family ATPase [Ruegeria sp. WL0004]